MEIVSGGSSIIVK